MIPPPRAHVITILSLVLLLQGWRPAAQQSLPRGQKWVAAWAASAHGPYPAGNATAQPVLDFAFESVDRGAIDQTFRLIIRPDRWGAQVRLRFANTFGTQPVVLDGVYVGLQAMAGNIVTGTNQPVTFGNGRRNLTLEAGRSGLSDPVTLRLVARAEKALLAGRKLAISFHVAGSTGPMTWHAKALQTSYVSAPRSGSHGADIDDDAFAFTSTSWFFLDALDVIASADAEVVACFGDSITDGTAATLNGDDRWPDGLSRRLHAAYADRLSVVNAGIGGNRITGPQNYSVSAAFAGGPSALDRLDRDVLSLPGVSTVIWLEGINDLSAGASVEAVIAGLRDGVARMRARGLRVVGATLTPSLGASSASGTPEMDVKRQAINAFIRTGGIFDGVVDFDRATVDPRTGGLLPAFQPNSTTGGPGDRLHPNRAGYQSMADAVDLGMLAARVPSR